MSDAGTPSISDQVFEPCKPGWSCYPSDSSPGANARVRSYRERPRSQAFLFLWFHLPRKKKEKNENARTITLYSENGDYTRITIPPKDTFSAVQTVYGEQQSVVLCREELTKLTKSLSMNSRRTRCPCKRGRIKDQCASWLVLKSGGVIYHSRCVEENTPDASLSVQGSEWFMEHQNLTQKDAIKGCRKNIGLKTEVYKRCMHE